MSIEEVATPSRMHIAPSPHIAAKESVTHIMLWVVGALMPVTAIAIYHMGWVAGRVILAGIITCLVSEWAWNALRKKPQTLGDGSALVTGLLLALVMPPYTPVWIVIAGGIVAIILAKQIFGGLGWNIFNPALVGRAVALLSWISVMAQLKPFPGGWYSALSMDAVGEYDAINGATRLAIAASDRMAGGAYNFDMAAQYGPLLFKNLEGSIGEVSGAALIVGGLVLILKGIVDWRIPVGYIGSVALLSYFFGSDPIFNVLAGGVLIGAFFMATDYVTSPVSRAGRLLFGIGCGTFNVIARFYGPMPEATTFAILFMNGLAPLIDRAFVPRVFGWEAKPDGK
ncbi:MAG: electron transporter RnfD [Actinobacteria bacterium HGW-Actinobacteria-10]|nr:MAG: electron transporter RnfD [Actinobacteria bacterium HGW-Actinobacteria-10]